LESSEWITGGGQFYSFGDLKRLTKGGHVRRELWKPLD
jgi:hypothetical protein